MPVPISSHIAVNPLGLNHAIDNSCSRSQNVVRWSNQLNKSKRRWSNQWQRLKISLATEKKEKTKNTVMVESI